MSANRNIFVTKPCNTFANIFDIFTCYSHNYIV